MLLLQNDQVDDAIGDAVAFRVPVRVYFDFALKALLDLCGFLTLLCS